MRLNIGSPMLLQQLFEHSYGLMLDLMLARIGKHHCLIV